MRRVLAVLASIWMVAQLGEYGTSDHCWILRGVTTRKPTPGERYWVTQDSSLNGWMQRVEVEHDTASDLDAAARSLGLKSASQCR